MTPGGKATVLQVRKVTWEDVDRGLASTMNQKALREKW
jgi:hypothetical protein